jgi:hypothetical protein
MEVTPDDSRFGSFAGEIPRRRTVTLSEPMAEFESIDPDPAEDPLPERQPLMPVYRGYPYPLYPVMMFQGQGMTHDGGPSMVPYFYAFPYRPIAVSPTGNSEPDGQ